MKSTDGENSISCNRRADSPSRWLVSSSLTQAYTGSREPSGAGWGNPPPEQARACPTDAMRRLAGGVVDRYVANVKIVETLAGSYGFRPLFFWQPTIFNKTALTEVEREEAQKYAWTEPAFRTVYEKIRASSELKTDPAFHELSRIFVDDKNLIFIDYCHTTETANARIADQIAAAVLSPKK